MRVHVQCTCSTLFSGHLTTFKFPYNRPVAGKHRNFNEICNERDVTFGVLGGPQKCIGIYGEIVMPPFKLRATPQLYVIRYLSDIA